MKGGDSLNDIGLFFAFAAGFLSFFSPCVFPLLPAYITHLTGGRVDQDKLEVDRKKLFIRSFSFIIGFSFIFIIMGASASFLGKLFLNYRMLIMQIAGILIIVFGLQMAGIFKLRFLMLEKKFVTNRKKKSRGLFRSISLGMAFASGWSPCVSLALSSILLLASSTNTFNQGIILLTSYSLGMAIPFLIISVVVTFSLKAMKRVNRYLSKLAFINGMIMVVLGILVLSGQMQKISAWLSAYSIF